MILGLQLWPRLCRGGPDHRESLHPVHPGCDPVADTVQSQHEQGDDLMMRSDDYKLVQADNDAGNRAVDSLINYETVKVISNLYDTRRVARCGISLRLKFFWCMDTFSISTMKNTRHSSMTSISSCMKMPHWRLTGVWLFLILDRISSSGKRGLTINPF